MRRRLGMYITAAKDVIALEPETANVIWRYTARAGGGFSPPGSKILAFALPRGGATAR